MRVVAHQRCVLPHNTKVSGMCHIYRGSNYSISTALILLLIVVGLNEFDISSESVLTLWVSADTARPTDHTLNPPRCSSLLYFSHQMLLLPLLISTKRTHTHTHIHACMHARTHAVSWVDDVNFLKSYNHSYRTRFDWIFVLLSPFSAKL